VTDRQTDRHGFIVYTTLAQRRVVKINKFSKTDTLLDNESGNISKIVQDKRVSRHCKHAVIKVNRMAPLSMTFDNFRGEIFAYGRSVQMQFTRISVTTPSPSLKRKRHDKNVNLFLLLGRIACTMRLIVVGFSWSVVFV